MNVTLRQLRYLQALAATGHFGRAAERCGVSQPALSMQIVALERIMGGDLVERHAGGARLTRLGADVTRRAGTVLAEVGELEHLARVRLPPLSGRLTLGVIPSIGPYLLPALLPHLRQHHRALALTIRETVTANLIGELQAGEIDVALISLPAGQAGLVERAIFRDPFRLAVPSQMPEPEGGWRAEALGEAHLLLLEDGHCLRDQTLAACGSAIGAAARGAGVASLETVLHLVAAGHGITLLPEIFVSRFRAESHPGIRVVALEAPAPARHLGLCWRAANARRADFEALAEAIAAIAPGTPGLGTAEFGRQGH